MNFAELTRVVLALQIHQGEDSDEPYIFRTYGHPADYEAGRVGGARNPGDACRHKIWEIALATTAAPGYFDPIKIDGITYEDPAAGFNNPTEEAMNEVLAKEGWHIHETGETPYPIAVLISIGTGEKPLVIERLRRRVPIRRIRKLIERVKRRLTDVDRVHDRVERVTVERGDVAYYRFQGPVEIGRIKMDEWKEGTQEFVDERFEEWIKNAVIDKRFNDAARSLVRLRRERIEADPERWRRWACCTTYVCRKCKEKKRHPQKLHSHIVVEHPDTPGVQEILQQSERPPDFQGGPY